MPTLEQHSQRLSLALKSAKCGLWDWAISADTIYFDPNYFLIAGYEPDEFPHHFDEWKKRVHPDDLGPVEKSIQQYLSRKIETYSVEFRFKTKRGEWMWILGTGEVSEWDENGNPSRFVGLHMNINERKHYEHQLQESESRYRSLFQNNHAVMLLIDPDTAAIVDANFSACTFYGYQKDALLQLKITDINQLSEQQVFAEMERARNEGRHHFYFQHRRASGDIRDVEVYSSPIRVDEKKLLYSIVHDISEKRLMEEKLQESEEKYRSLYDNAPLAYQSLDEDGCFLDVNPAWLRILGYARDDVIGQWYGDFLHPEWTQHFKIQFPAFKERGYVKDVQFKIRHKDGHYLDISFEGCIGYTPEGTFKQTYCVFQDITEGKRAEKALHDSEAKLSSIVRSAPIGIGQVTNRTINFVNEQFARMLGYSVQELIGQSSRIVYPSDEEFERVGQYKYAEIKKNGTGSIETILQKKDGSLIDVFLSSTPVDLNDFSKGVTFTALDITDRKGAEQVLRSAAHEWRLIMDEFEDVIYLLDNDRRLLRANAAFFKAMQTTPEQAIGRHIVELVHPQGEDDPCPVCLAQEEKRDVSLVMEADDEHNPAGRPIEIKVKMMRDQMGASTGILMTLHDLTQARLAEQSLRESEEKFRLFADYTYDWEYWLSPQGDYVYVSPSCEQVTGYRPDEFISNPKLIFDLVRPDYVESVRRHYFDDNSENIPVCLIEFPIRNKTGEERWIEHHCSPVFDEQGHYVGRRGNNRDITDRKKAEEERLDLETQLRQKYKMDSIGVMAGGMAHNFNNNLSIILGNVELSKMKMLPDPVIDGYLNNAKTAVLRSRDLIQQILTYSRQGGKDKTSTQLPRVIAETLQLLRSTMPSTMNLRQKISSDSHNLTINADASQVQECLINLCNNAMHAMDEKGDLTIALDRVELQEQEIPAQYESRPGAYARLSVQDTGHGMSAEIVDKVFDLFFTTKPVGEGTGVGLSTVQGIVTQNGGLIKVDSHPGEGTTFELYFPVNSQTQTPHVTTVNGDLPQGAEQILFVDDDPMLARLGEQMLKTMGYKVSVMNDSQDALKLFTANADHIDLVITDQTMPNLTGEELLQKIKEIRPDIPTILCTGFSSKIDKDKAEKLGIDAFLMKPLDMPTFLQTVRRVLDREKES